jgi:aarF domain-containing kinase
VSKIPTSVWGRGRKLVGLASKLALSELSTRLKSGQDEVEKLQSRVKLAQDLVKTLSQLKGASMKVGQLLSLDLGDFLPPEVIKVLETLQHNSSYLGAPEIQEILTRELGEKLSLLENFSPTPLAAASIGQVHSAHFKGKEVVIKIQYPGVAESIPSDLRLLEVLVKNLASLQGKSLDLTGFFREIEDVLIKETDYEREAQMILKYRELFKNSQVIIPEVFMDVSTKKIITMERIYAKSFNQWHEHSLMGERIEMARKMIQLYLEEFFVHGLVQTDPNPGNFLITEKNQIALLDFGAVKEYELSFRHTYREILKASYAKDSAKILEHSFALGLLDPRESQETRELYVRMMDQLVEPYRQESEFDFSNKIYLHQSRDLSWQLTRMCKYSPPPKEIIFLHRRLAGIFVLIRKLDVKLKLRDFWAQMSGEGI